MSLCSKVEDIEKTDAYYDILCQCYDEIRDNETANTSVEAANTGHLLLSTIHANCAVTTVASADIGLIDLSFFSSDRHFSLASLGILA
ncbi:MAG TPA: hypothetical protein EYP03_02105, partial [Aquificae bacterium]|nr:hypothetical protein [Aquificota bacterium]